MNLLRVKKEQMHCVAQEKTTSHLEQLRSLLFFLVRLVHLLFFHFRSPRRSYTGNVKPFKNIIYFFLCIIFTSHLVFANQNSSQKLRVQISPGSCISMIYSAKNFVVSEESCGVDCKNLTLTLLKGTHGELNFRLIDFSKFFLTSQNVVIPFDVENNKLTTPMTSYRIHWMRGSMLDMIANVQYLDAENIYRMNINSEF